MRCEVSHVRNVACFDAAVQRDRRELARLFPQRYVSQMAFWLEYIDEYRRRLGMFETLREAEVFGRQMSEHDPELSEFVIGTGDDVTPGTGEVIRTLSAGGVWEPSSVDDP